MIKKFYFRLIKPKLALCGLNIEILRELDKQTNNAVASVKGLSTCNRRRRTFKLQK